jgi:hypothetical protein
MNKKKYVQTSTSWNALKPLRDFNGISASGESVEEYSKRLHQIGHTIPYLVLEQ